MKVFQRFPFGLHHKIHKILAVDDGGFLVWIRLFSGSVSKCMMNDITETYLFDIQVVEIIKKQNHHTFTPPFSERKDYLSP